MSRRRRGRRPPRRLGPELQEVYDPVRARRSYHRRRATRRQTAGWLILILVLVVGVGWSLASTRLGGGGETPPPAATEPPPVPITFPEGLRREDMARMLEEQTELSGDRYLELTAAGTRGQRLARADEPRSLEGFLFPATYQIGSQTTVARLVDAQVDAYRRNTAGIDYRWARKHNLTRYDVLIVASMIEREVQVPRERRLVAGVIYNRLRNGMHLGIDATVQYALGEWKETLTADDLAVDSPYNTRRYVGLPPGPISNPGLASIEAAANPRETGYLYYVARSDGTGRHYFARTAEEHEKRIAQAQANVGG